MLTRDTVKKKFTSFFIVKRDKKVCRTKRAFSNDLKKHFVLVTGSLFTLMLQGCGEPSMDEIKTKIVKVETPHGKYTTVNKSSGAYGKYQIMPKTARHYTKKLNIPHSQWKRPENQDKIFIALLEDNVKNLKKHEFEVDAFTVYGCHQQGANGFVCIMKNKNLSNKSYMRLRRNLPSKYRNIQKNELRQQWINYWKHRMEEV